MMTLQNAMYAQELIGNSPVAEADNQLSCAVQTHHPRMDNFLKTDNAHLPRRAEALQCRKTQKRHLAILEEFHHPNIFLVLPQKKTDAPTAGPCSTCMTRSGKAFPTHKST